MNGPAAAVAPLTGDPPIVSVHDVSKRYGGTQALAGVSLDIASGGEVHGLIGENGSGKSTLLAIMAGQTRPDSGTVSVGGAPVSLSSPVDAVRRGISLVAQETAVAPDLTVAENVLMGRRHLPRGRAGVSWKRAYDRAAAVLDLVGADYDPCATVRGLRPDQRQMVEIARGVAADARLLILDEPTSSLTDPQVEGLFEAVRRLAQQGVSVLFVSHRLPELYAVTDRITVLRDGHLVASLPTAGYPRAELVHDMVGNSHAIDTVARRRSAVPGPCRLSIQNVAAPDEVRGVSLTVAAGEIVGLAGLAGAGRTELLEVVFGLRRPTSGQLLLDGEPLPHGVSATINAGVAFVPPDRRAQGLIAPMSVSANLALTLSRHHRRLAVPDVREEIRLTNAARDRLRLRAASADARITTLSGGNQQKIVVGKWLQTQPRLLLLDEPTRGVDVAAKADIHQMLGEAADAGMGILLSSSDAEELLAVCDRIVVLHRGRTVRSIDRAEATEELLVHTAGGLT